MQRRIHPLLWGLAALLALFLVWEVLGLRRGPDEITPVRDRLRDLRAAADSCQGTLEGESLRFQAYDERLDSLRERVRAMERIDPRGVPADSYQTYLSAFDAYNDSVAGWEAHADTVRVRWERCRALAEAHNLLADSLRDLLVRQLEESQQR